METAGELTQQKLLELYKLPYNINILLCPWKHYSSFTPTIGYKR